MIGFVEGNGTTTEIQNYIFIDNLFEVEPGLLYYRLKQVDFDGSFEYSDAVEVEVTIINEFKLLQNYPNPFNPTTKIEYQIPKLSFVTIKVYDVLGNEIATLVNNEKQAGSYEISWYSENLPSGVYFYRLQAGNFIDTKKMILLK
ncbi:MAG: T9SS type A sorting domain-containing protein [Ignavibacteria bacterium]|nr:T9SS type A sorting domain-containing protein [Ignavibacteria bacterium]MBT8382764.1 T9SS type A sorting domain-containing protein [Ignavibacteria bacterium]MBT8391214.1 T9SS type A sorting domain-containing protein [Ignavibacteria bacterium]NNL22441.1 T9SS type A sorting domain-containing protein [Ignavibacteriaceae bacterium]